MVQRSIGIHLLLVGSLLAVAPPQEKQPTATAANAVVIKVAKQAEKKPFRPLQWSLLIHRMQQQEGNAATLWLRAGLAGRAVRHAWTDREQDWTSADQVPLNSLPVKDVEKLLEKYAGTLRQVERAAHMSRCYWEYPPLTFQNLTDLPLEDIQLLRELTRVISLHCRMELARGNFDAAQKDLQQGLTLARHTGSGRMMLQDLVALAISNILLSRVEEWVQLSGSPNLYWALTELPRPVVSVRQGIRTELQTIYRSFPSLRKWKSGTLTAAESTALADQVIESLLKRSNENSLDWEVKVGKTLMIMRYQTDARKALIERGRTEKEVNALPASQTIALYFLEDHDRLSDEYLRCLALPSWQGYPMMRKIYLREMAWTGKDKNPLILLLMPAIYKVYVAQVRTERTIAALRTVEAIRMYIGEHGKPPAKLADITRVPLPIDPFTGKGFDDWYQVKDGKAILSVPAPPEHGELSARRYEFASKVK